MDRMRILPRRFGPGCMQFGHLPSEIIFPHTAHSVLPQHLFYPYWKPAMRTKILLISVALAVTTLSAQAFERPFPPAAKRGVMTPAVSPTIIINDKTRRLTAGARIWNQNNTIDMPAALRGSNLPVNYTEIDSGEIDRVWILTADEAAKAPPKPVVPATPLPAPLPAPASKFQ